MEIFLWIISIFWLIAGCAFLIIPIPAKDLIKKMTKLPKLLLGIIPSIVGILFLLASPTSSWSWFIAILGMLALLKGIFVLISPVGLIKNTLGWWFNQPSSLYRFWGIIMLILAILVISSITG